MFAENLEEFSILVFVQCSEVLRHFSILTTVELQLSTHLTIDADVQLCEVDLVYDCGILFDGSLNIFHARTVDVVVALHTNTVDWHTGILHLLNHIEDTVALCRIGSVIVIVEKKYVRVCLACKLECLSDELVATQLEMA